MPTIQWESRSTPCSSERLLRAQSPGRMLVIQSATVGQDRTSAPSFQTTAIAAQGEHEHSFKHRSVLGRFLSRRWT